jgi:hypothetical protein
MKQSRKRFNHGPSPFRYSCKRALPASTHPSPPLRAGKGAVPGSFAHIGLMSFGYPDPVRGNATYGLSVERHMRRDWLHIRSVSCSVSVISARKCPGPTSPSPAPLSTIALCAFPLAFALHCMSCDWIHIHAISPQRYAIVSGT